MPVLTQPLLLFGSSSVCRSSSSSFLFFLCGFQERHSVQMKPATQRYSRVKNTFRPAAVFRVQIHVAAHTATRPVAPRTHTLLRRHTHHAAWVCLSSSKAVSVEVSITGQNVNTPGGASVLHELGLFHPLGWTCHHSAPAPPEEQQRPSPALPRMFLFSPPPPTPLSNCSRGSKRCGCTAALL